MKYFLSAAADTDLQDIYEYGYRTWGEHQAARYIGELYELFASIAQSPGMGRARPELHPNVQSLPHVSHTVFFIVLPEGVAITRVLHGAADHQRTFEDYDPLTDLPE